MKQPRRRLTRLTDPEQRDLRRLISVVEHHKFSARDGWARERFGVIWNTVERASLGNPIRQRVGNLIRAGLSLKTSKARPQNG